MASIVQQVQLVSHLLEFLPAKRQKNMLHAAKWAFSELIYGRV